MNLHFTAHTINCVCHSIRSMFRVLGIYNFVDTPNAPEYISTQFVCPSPKVLDFNEKRLYWVSAVRVSYYRKWKCTSQLKSAACTVRILFTFLNNLV